MVKCSNKLNLFPLLFQTINRALDWKWNSWEIHQHLSGIMILQAEARMLSHSTGPSVYDYYEDAAFPEITRFKSLADSLALNYLSPTFIHLITSATSEKETCLQL